MIAMNGQNVCRYHGGATKKARTAAARRIAEEEVADATRRALAVLDVEPIDNPLTALSELAGQVVAWKDRLSFRVNALERIRYEDDKGAEQLRAEVALYERAMDRCINVLATIGRLKIDERLAAISEKQADLVITAIEAALAHAGITGEQAAQAKKVAARHLRSVS
ncbi:hypothetical protein ACFCYB_00110 [Streptomyces sp. NPDC056309]|uniref:hypothetical protein n=1 Tax=Streptomyces sp. NPDC056309 TaxID=3345781 RepID=UPI0035DE1083